MGKRGNYGPPLIVLWVLGAPLILLIEGCRLTSRLFKKREENVEGKKLKRNEGKG
tara:strand:+ start:156 stop:320 length:165 start_codon:yes stop_codon:yes gene_type:complete